MCCVLGKRDEGAVRKNKNATVERLFHLEMKGTDGKQAISKGNIITFSYLLLEHCGGGRGRKGEEGGERRGRWRRGAFKSNNPSLRYIHFFSHSRPPPPCLPHRSLITFGPNLSILLYIFASSTCNLPASPSTFCRSFFFFFSTRLTAAPPHPSTACVRNMTNSGIAPKMR